MNYEKIYEYRFSAINQDKKNDVWSEIAEFVYPLMGNPRTILDPAAGRCEFLSAVTAAKERWVVDKMPLDARLLDNIRFIQGDIFKVDLPVAYFDGVFISNFLEHLDSPDEIFSLFIKLRECLRETGVITIMGPNFKYAFKEYFDCADHRLALTHLSVEELLYSAGFQIEKIIPQFLPFSFRGMLPPSRMLTRVYLNLPFLWKLFGKQFLILARKCGKQIVDE